MTEQVTIGILVNRAKPLPAYGKHAGKKKLLVFSPKGINWSEKTTSGYLYDGKNWLKGVYPLPAAVYNRLYTSKKTIANKLEKLIGKGKVFNRFTRLDKWRIYKLLVKTRIQPYLPATYLYSPGRLTELLDTYDQLILKPRRGQLGKRVYLVEKTVHKEYRLFINVHKSTVTQDSFKAHGLNIDEKLLVPAKIRSANKEEFVQKIDKLLSKKPFIIQEFIPLDEMEQKIYDIRMYVQKDGHGLWSPSGGFSRVANPNSYISNLCTELKSHEELVRLNNNQLSLSTLDKMKGISLDVANIIENGLGHFGELAIDFGLDKQGKPWIIEVNGRTQKHFIKRLQKEQLTRQVYAKPLEYAHFLAVGTSKRPSILQFGQRLADIWKRQEGKQDEN